MRRKSDTRFRSRGIVGNSTGLLGLRSRHYSPRIVPARAKARRDWRLVPNHIRALPPVAARSARGRWPSRICDPGLSLFRGIMARRKITKPAKQLEDMAADDLPDLTARQMEFVRGLLEGKTAAESYRHAYDCSKMQSNSVWVAASRARSDANVALWLARARKAELGHCNITLDQHIRRLDRLEVIAEETGNIGAAVQAEQLIGKAKGFYVERFEDVTPLDPMALFERLTQIDPDMARLVAKKHGISLPGPIIEHQTAEA